MTVGLDDLDLTGALLTARWTSIGVDRRLAVLPDGSAWYWSLATTGPGADEVGTYRLHLDDDTLSRVGRLARTVTDGAAPDPGRLGFTVTAGPATERVPEGTDRAGEIVVVIAPLLDALRAAPLAVARWTIALARAPGGELLAGFSVAALGSRPVTLLFDADRLDLIDARGTVAPVPAPRMGLVTAEAVLLDGLYQPATLPPGRSATCAVVLPNPTAQGNAPSGDAPRRGSVTGSVGVTGPWATVGERTAEPMLAFTSRPAVSTVD